MHRESVSIIVQQDLIIYSFIIFLQTALHVSDVVEESEIVPTPPRQRTAANTVRPVPDVVIRVCMCS